MYIDGTFLYLFLSDRAVLFFSFLFSLCGNAILG
jgi:hypothetical protein